MDGGGDGLQGLITFVGLVLEGKSLGVEIGLGKGGDRGDLVPRTTLESMERVTSLAVLWILKVLEFG
jgi:hypothetical protein